MTDQVAWIKELNRRILDGIAAKRVELIAKLEEAARHAEGLRAGIAALDTKQEQLLAAEQLQISTLQAGAIPDPVSETAADEDATEEEEYISHGPVREKGKLKARIGDQRYLILSIPRRFGDVTMPFIIFRTGLQERRVKDAVGADVALGVLEKGLPGASGEDSYRLTEVGSDLMQRFDDYRRQRGFALPTLPEIENVSRVGTAPDGTQAHGDLSETQSFPTRPGLVWEMSSPS